MLVLPGLERQAGVHQTEQVRSALAGDHFLTEQQRELRITVSCGIAAYPEDAETMVDLRGNADHVLFEAKRWGKNSVCTDADLLQPPGAGDFLPLERRTSEMRRYFFPFFPLFCPLPLFFLLAPPLFFGLGSTRSSC